ncbi:ABC transporter permease [Photobacterium frigidiphilum]|uniref:ABC transporter permease n=1 Tax=Photobacterium frigidiphilum TaxID=264736 RepID=A0A2T3JP41_9GAMM|nr:FtsX-like permease family protein [Photobacterium frigidiphilum]PSU50817.1 ABC transporter permease [Photobacterium frigidiphilum]
MTDMTDSQKVQKRQQPKLLLKWSWRELWQGQLWPVAVALTLIIACVFALAALVSRVEKIMTDQGRSVLAADLVLVSNNPIEPSLLSKAEALGLTFSEQTRFGTMAFSEQQMQLISVKAVESDFPLRGQLALQDRLNVQSKVNPGELWLSERLFSLLDVKEGDIVAIGDAELKVSGKIAQEPELSFNPFSQMPAVLIHEHDVAATGAVQPGGRVQYRLYFMGSDDKLAAIQKFSPLEPGQRWLSETSQGRTGEFIDRARQYLSLTLILVILMATATLVLTCQHYTSTRVETVAMMKSLGASKRWLWRWLSGQLAMLFGLSAIAGLSIGWGLEVLLRLPLADILPDPLPDMGMSPWLISMFVALLVAIPGIGIPLIRLLDAPAISVIQQQADRPKNNKAYALLLLPVAAALIWFGDNKLMWMTLAGIVVVLVLLAFFGLVVLSLLRKRKWGPAMTLALSRISRSPLTTGAQLAALTSSLMLLAVIWLLRSDLLADWQQTLPIDAPNVFAINISAEQQPDYLAKLDQENIPHSEAYPVIRGRIVAVNGIDLLTQVDDPEQRDEALRRELNFTWRETLPIHNDVLDGNWPEPELAIKGVSVESGIAERLGLSVGDELGFNVNSQPFSAMVNSIRHVEWRNMRPNFYFIFTPDVMVDLPATWLVSFRIESNQNDVVNQLGRDYPTVSLMDLRTMASRIQLMLQQVSLSLSVLAALGVLSGLLLVMTLLRLSMAQRQQEIKLYRTLGASRKRISATVWGEYGLMALIAGLMAVVGAEAIVAALVKWGFEMPPQWHPMLWIMLPTAAIGLVLFIISTMLKQLLQPLKS